MSALVTIRYDRQSPAPEIIERLAEHLMIGGLAVLPTDTTYALVGDATAEPAAQADESVAEADQEEGEESQ